MTAPATTVLLSHDGVTYVDVTAYVAAENGLGITFSRGRNNAQAEWVAGSASISFRNQLRSVDPSNDAATFQIRPGDWIQIKVAGNAQWPGWASGNPVATYEQAGGGLFYSTLTINGTDVVGLLANQTITTTATTPELTYSRISNICLFYTDFQHSMALDPTATEYVSGATDGSDINGANALSAAQNCVYVEGGSAALFARKDGYLRYLGHEARPSQVVTLGGSGGIPFHGVEQEYNGDEWFNKATWTPTNYSYSTASGTSVTTGTGSKTFVIVGGATEAGCAAAITSDGSSASMLGTVTSFDPATSTMVVNVGGTTGSGTHSDWTVVLTPNALPQTATDAQSVARFKQTRATPSTGTLTLPFLGNTSALARATLVASSQGYPSRRVSSVTVELGAISGANQTTVLGLEIGDAVSIYLDLGTGDPQVIRQTRVIVGIAHRITGTGSHRVTFQLGSEATMNFTVVLKQGGSTPAFTNNECVYKIDGAGWCDGHVNIASTAAGSAGTEIKLTPTGLPAPATGATSANAAGAGTCVGWGEWKVTSGASYLVSVTWDGTDLRMRVSGASSAAYLGVSGGSSVSLTVASGDTLSLTFKFRPA